MAKVQSTINGNLLSTFGAKLVEYEVGPCSYSDSYLLPPKSIIPVRLNGNVGLRKVTIVLDFFGASEGVIALAISNLTAELIKKSELYLPDGFYYNCVYIKASTPEYKASWIKRVKFEFNGYRHGARVDVPIFNGTVVNVLGNFETPVKYDIQESSAVDHSVSINGITVKNVTKRLIIDGMTATVTMDGINKFGDTDIVEFPKLKPGENKIYLNGSPSAMLTYYPIYL